jgi:hypothetical protein
MGSTGGPIVDREMLDVAIRTAIEETETRMFVLKNEQLQDVLY